MAKITELLIAELDQEAIGIRKTLQQVPEGKNDWKPHPRSMPLGQLATIVATIPAWLDMVVNRDELDINPAGGPSFRPPEWKTRTPFPAAVSENCAAVADGLRQ